MTMRTHLLKIICLLLLAVWSTYSLWAQQAPDANFTPFTEVQQLLANDGAPLNYFGGSVAIEGDYMLVGADGRNNRTGAVYAFVRVGGVWQLSQTLTASDGKEGDRFGVFLSMSGEYAFIASAYDNRAGFLPSAAYVFHQEGLTWVEQDKLTGGFTSSEGYGSAVGVDGDYAILGAGGYDGVADNTGLVDIYIRNATTGTWELQQRLEDTIEPNYFDEFGQSVAIGGDYALVGAPQDDLVPGDDGCQSGSVFVFARTGTSWNLQNKLTAPNPVCGVHFGYSLSISGDYALIGARHDDEGASDGGAAHIFMRDSNTGQWVFQDKLIASNVTDFDWAGTAVALDGDYAVVGAPNYNGGEGNLLGYAVVFVRQGVDWVEVDQLMGHDSQAGHNVGGAVALQGTEVIVGASGFNFGPPEEAEGAVYVFTQDAPVLTVSSPDGGEAWNKGSSQTITWTDNIVGNVKIELFRNGIFNATISASTESDGSYTWAIPANQATGSTYKIHITSLDTPTLTDASNSNFTIRTATSVRVLSPNGGEVWCKGETVTITWLDNLSGNVKIELLQDGTSIKIIASSTASDGLHGWTVANSPPDNNNYKIRITSVAPPTILDESDTNFTITTCTSGAKSAANGDLTAFGLSGAYPNPFNPATAIRYALPQAGAVRLVVYNMLGQEVARLVEGLVAAGRHEVVFDGQGLPSGVYLYRLEAGTFVQTRRMTLVK
jgi:hypothetical protein